MSLARGPFAETSRYHKVQLEVGFCLHFIYVVSVPGISWRVLFSAHPRSPSTASALLPSYYCFTQYHTFNAAFHRIVQYDAPFVFRLSFHYFVFLCSIDFTLGFTQNVGMGSCCLSCIASCGRPWVPHFFLAGNILVPPQPCS